MTMAQQIEAVYQRVRLLRQGAAESPLKPDLLQAALSDLSLVLEELQTSEEELRLQNQALLETRQQVEAERQRYQDLFDLAPDGYLVTDQLGVIQEANVAIAALLKVSPSYLIGKPMLLFVGETNRSIFYAALEYLRQPHLSRQPLVQSWEIQLCPYQGIPVHVAITLSATHYAPGAEASCRWLLRDTTQQRQIKQFLEQLNTELDRQVKERTAQLQQSLDFEASLKRITDKVRDSLDEAQIMQTVVRELAVTLDVSCCNASQYDLEHNTALISYEHTRLNRPYKNRAIRISSNPAIYRHLLHHRIVQYCPIPVDPERGNLVMMAAPIFDDQGVLGDLWLIDQKTHSTFSELDIRLVHQVANQCAIAIRQARLYQAAQQQVQILTELHRLKDTFLSTVSHELRTPLSNMNMAINMLDLLVKHPDQFPDKVARFTRYLSILRTQCQQETNLINDLLDLSRIEADTDPLTLTTFDFKDWLLQTLVPFEERFHRQQQRLQITIYPDLPPLTTDARLLGHIVAELLNNACKYTPIHETIAITATAVDQTLHLSIKNSGIDLPPNELERLFERFHRVPNHDPWQYGGTGLGLALVEKRTKQLRGAIAVTNAQGWITFTLQLPWSIGLDS